MLLLIPAVALNLLFTLGTSFAFESDKCFLCEAPKISTTSEGASKQKECFDFESDICFLCEAPRGSKTPPILNHTLASKKTRGTSKRLAELFADLKAEETQLLASLESVSCPERMKIIELTHRLSAIETAFEIQKKKSTEIEEKQNQLLEALLKESDTKTADHVKQLHKVQEQKRAFEHVQREEISEAQENINGSQEGKDSTTQRSFNSKKQVERNLRGKADGLSRKVRLSRILKKW